jgi:hypothetical protein
VAEPSKALHKAIIAALGGISCPVYDGVPQNTRYPYVVIDTGIANNADMLVERMQERFVYLNVWSESRGQAEVLGIIAEIDAALHNARLSLETGSAVSVRVDSHGTRRDADNVTFTGYVTLRVITKH